MVSRIHDHTQWRVRSCLRLGAACLIAGLATGCASNLEELSSSVVLSGKYAYHNCEQLAKQTQTTAARVAELRGLMERSAQGPGGAIVNAVAYQNDYLIAHGNLQQLEAATMERNCEPAAVNGRPPR